MGGNERREDRELERLPEGRQEGGWKGGQGEEEDEGTGMMFTDTQGQTDGGEMISSISFRGGAGKGGLMRIDLPFFSGVHGGIERSVGMF
jgi:hypothetical protein